MRFVALKSKASGFFVLSIRKIAVLIIFSLVGTSLFTQDAVERVNADSNFRPRAQSINVFPSRVTSDSWNNVETLNSQDVGEYSLLQDFNTENSAFINTQSIDEDTNVSDRVSRDVSEVVVPLQEGVLSEDVVVPETTGDTPVDESETHSEPEPIQGEPDPEPTVQPLESARVDAFEKFAYTHAFKEVSGQFLFAQADITDDFSEGVVAADHSESHEEESDEMILVSDPIEEHEAVIPDVNIELSEQPVADDVLSEEPVSVIQDVLTDEGVIGDVETVGMHENESQSREGVYTIELSDFGVPNLSSGQFIDNLQLRLSLAGQYTVENLSQYPSIEIEYSFGAFDGDAGSIIIEDEISNALNGGYYLIPLPSITDPELLRDLIVTISFVGDVHELQSLFLDAAWLDVGTVVFDKDLLKERFSTEEMMKHLDGPQRMELISHRLDFLREELPQFNLRYNSQRNILVQAFRSLFGRDLATVESVAFIHNEGEEIDISPEVTVTPEGLISVVLTEADKDELFPGIYSVVLEIDEGGFVSTDTFEFQWGLLSINSNQTTYESGDIAEISMGALTSNGNTLCDANLNLYISDPNGFISSTHVLPSGYCNGNNIIDVPDYSSQFVTGVPGEYEMYLERVDESGNVISHTSETFLVAAEQPIAIERSGPTRIYPPSPYAMELTIHALRRSFSGEIVERVPKSFTVFNTDAEIRSLADYTELVWNVSMASGTSYAVSYEFDAPDISPYLYELGPAQLVSDENEIIPLAIPVVVETEEVIDVDTVLPRTDDEVLPPAPAPGDEEGEGVTGPEVVPTETVEGVVTPVDVPEEVSSESVIPLSDTLISGESTPSEVPIVPAMTPSDVPASLEAPHQESVDETVENPDQAAGGDRSYITAFKQAVGKFLFAQAETTEPVAPLDTVEDSMIESIENATSTVLADEGTFDEVLVASTTSSHIVFVEHRQWQIASDATGNMLLYWDGTNIPSGWTCVSCLPGDVFYQRFIQGSSTAGINGGAATHTHTATGVVSTSASSTSINSGGGGATNVPTVAHAHTYTPTISTDSNLPAYRELSVIQYNSAGSPPTIPTGAIAVFDAAVPTGWTQYAAQDGSYVRSASTSTVGTTGGSNTHTHTITGNLLGTGNFTTSAAGDNLVNTASAAHTHAVNSTTGATNHEPRYREAVLGKLNATSSPTDAMIAMWTDEAPIGWGMLSGPSDPFENRFVKASTTYGGVGGAATTTHSDVNGITSGGPSGTQTRDLVTIDNTVTTDAHTHQLNVTNFSATLTLPPYRTVVFAKRDVGGAIPDAPVVSALFDNEQTGTSTPIFEFIANDPDGADTLVYQFQWDDDVDLDTSPTGDRTSDSEGGCSPNCFVNTASSTDTHPYTENEQMRFTIQTPLTNGVTYYWRVRAKETVGNVWSDWSAVRSFTYESGVDPSTWFQTVGNQFETGTLTNIATTSGAAQLATTSTRVPVVSSWTSNTATTAASVVLTKPSGVEIGDLLLILVGNDDNTATAQWNNTTLKPSGFTLINEAGNNNPDTHVAAFYRVADGTEASTSSVPSQATVNNWGFYLRVTGASTTNPLNVAGADYAVNNLVSHPVPSVTTTQANTLAFYMLAGDAVGTAPFTVSGTGWSESAEKTVNTAGTWGTRSMTSAGATGNATVAMNANDGASGFQFAINPSLPYGTLMSPEIDFDSVSGQTDWGVVTWDTTEPPQTDTILQLFYTNTLECDTLVPDSALPGNSTGFDATESELFINTLSTTTYNRICLRMSLNEGFGTTSPSLLNWMVDWAVPNQVPYTPNLANTPAFNNERATTTLPRFGGFAASDFEGDAMEFELIVSTSSDLSAPILTKHSSDYPTDAGWTASTFASGATTTYIVQPGDELAVGTMYWWAVRARDPFGTNTWSATSTVRSLSVSTYISVPEWYQTVNAQFDEGVFSNATSSSNGVEIETIGTPSTVITAQADWLQQYTSTAYPAGTVNASYAISAGTDRMLVVAIGSTRTTVGTQSVSVTYGGQAMTLAVGDATNATNRNHTYIFYLNDAGIAAASTDDLDVTITGGTSYYNYVYAAVFAGVDQTTVYTDARNYFSGATANATVGPFSAGLSVNTGDQAIEVINLARSTAGAGVRTVTAWSNGTWPSPSSVAATYSPGSNWGLGFHINNRNVTTSGTQASGHTASAAGTHDSMSGISLKVAGTGSQGTIMSPEVDHDSVPNQSTWGEVSWGVTEPAGSETRMRVYYSSTTVCDTIIPDGALSGNSTGFGGDTSPLDISTLSTSTYNRICLQMELQQDSASTSPSLDDWTVSWVLSPQFTQQDYSWYANAASTTPTDVWPVGGVDLNENESIDSSISVLNNEVLRLRMSLVGTSTNATPNSVLFKTQFAEGDTCSVDLEWIDIGDAASTTALWRGYENGLGTDDWYDENWSNRTRITIQASQIDAALTNFPVYVNLDDLSSTFFSTVETDGRDIRVTESDGVTEVPIELVSIDTSGTDGELYFRATSLSSTTDTTFYVYYGNSGASAYASTSLYGARNVWSNGYVLVSHMDDLTTSVVENSAGALNGTKTSAGNPAEVSTGPVYEAQDLSLDLVQYTGTMLTNATQYAVSLWFNPDALTGAGDLATYGLSLYGISPTGAPYQWLTAGGTGALTELRLCAYENTATTCVPTSGAGLTTGNWYHTSVNAVAGGSTTVRINGTQRLSYTNGNEGSVGANFTIGDLRGTPQRNVGFDGRVDEVRVSTTTRADAWRDAEYRNMATSTDFYTAVDDSSGGSADGYTLTTLLLTDSDVLGTYEEGNPTAPNPNAITVGDAAEWDFVLQNNNANPGAQYCFRMVNADGSELNAYTQFPALVTNASPGIEEMFAPFDNEKLASTSPWFEFIGYDENGDEVDYQIQIDNDYAFSSTVIDTDSESNLDDFLNIGTPSDKTPFNNYARIRYTIPSSLTNGVTYWWRVRSKDASGSAVYGEWSTPESFTIDTSLTVSTWYQTTEEQFNTNTHDGTEATVADLVAFASGSTVATTTSSAIHFADATIGNVWGELSFNETGSANDILYHIEYEDDGDWYLIPDSALAGNAAGYDSSPVVLSGLDVSLYDVIRIRANFENGSPTLLDWTLAWGESIEVPTTISPFDNEKFATTTPTLQFYSADPENDDIEYEVSWSTDYAFASGSTTKNSSTTPTGFVNLSNGGDTNPFGSGDTVAYTVQSGDTLSASTTYWWRARAKDPTGSDTFSTWSEPMSFTTATSGESVSVSTWFQTLGLQFERGTLSGVTAATNSIEIGGGLVVESGWTSNTAVPGNSLTLTKPAGVASGDLLIILVGNDDNTATAQWNNTTLKPSGFTLINEAGDATLSDAHVAAFYRVANGSEGTTINVPAQISADYWGFYLRITGASTTDPINVTGADYLGGAAVSHPVTGITTTEDQAMAFYVLSGDGGDVYPFTVSGTGWTESAEIQAGGGTANAAGAWGTRLMTTAGATGDATVGMSVSDSASGFQFAINPAVLTSGTVKSAPIDFDDGNGPGWGELSWRDTEPGSSEVLYQLEFLNTLDVWELIPDSALTGNSTGFTTAPIDIEALNTTTYNQIRVAASLNCSGPNCPTLNDWTIRWIRGFTVSGTAVEYDGISSTTAGTVAVAVNGVLQSGANGTIQSDGTWEVENIPLFSGDVVTVFVSGANDADEAVAITTFDGTPDVTGMKLQKRHLTIGSQDYVTVTNAHIGEYDYTNDEDIFLDVNGGSDLTLCADTGCSDASIVVLARNGYAPGTGADVTTHDFRNYGTFTAGSNSIRVSGSWDNNATSTMTGSTLIFTATSTTEFIDENGAQTSGFNNVTFGETSGTATWTPSSTLAIAGNLSVTYGTLSRGTTSITVSGNLTTGANGFWTGMGTTTFDGINPGTWTDSNATKQNVGKVVVDGTSKTVVLGSDVAMQSMTIGANDAFDASITGFTASVYGDWINNNTFTARTGTVAFVATTTNRIITSGTSAFYNLTFAGAGGSWSFTAPTLTVSNHFTIATGTVTMPTATTTVAGSFLNTGGVFAHNNGTVAMSSSAGGRSITQSGSVFLNAFYNLTFTGSGSWAFTESNATTSNIFRIQAGTVTFPSGTLTVHGDFITTGTGAFAHNSGEVIFVVQNSNTVSTNGSSFNNVRTRGGIATSWYNDSWTNRIPVTIQASQVDATLTNFPVYVNLDDLSSTFFSTVETDGRDIRVTESDGVTEVPIELVSIDTSGTDGELYFRATSLSSTTDTTFYVYYGNSGASAYASTSLYGARNVWSNSYILVDHMNDLTTSSVLNSAGAIQGIKTDTAGSPVSSNPLEVSTGRANEAQSFDTVPIQHTGTFLSGQTQYNVSMWFNPDTLAGAAPQETNTYGYSLYGVSTGGAYDWTSVGGTPAPDEVCVRAFTNVTTCNVTSGADLVANNWYHLSVNAIRNSTLTARVNGVTRGTFVAGNTAPTANFTISGLRPNRVPPISFDGRIDEVRVSTTTRTDAWRDAEYRNVSTSTTFYTAGAEEGSRARRFTDTNATILGNYVSELGGDAVFPTGVLSIGGSFDNDAVFDAHGGTVRFNSSGGSEAIAPGTSVFATLDFNNASGDFTITEHATATAAVNLTSVSQFTVNSGVILTSEGSFTHAANGNNTTWSGSTLRLMGPDSALNSKSHAGDVYGTLLVVGDTDISMWNSSADSYTTLDTASLYSQDHSGVDGDLYIFGDYARTSGTEYWSYATDFDGTALGGSSRQVDVRLASGTIATLGGSTFSLTGTSTATTTIANQGSGTYVVVASSTMTTFNYYEFSNLGTAGVTLRGSGVIASLNDGSVRPGVSAGTGFTVASSTINANPGLQIYRVDFSTTTAISATNVTQSGGAPTSYWWFRDSLGNIDGEAFDNDTGDPGSIRWDDSSLVITVSGVVYSDDGVTTMGNPVCDDVTATIRVVIQGGSSYTGDCASADGTFSIPGVVVVGDPVVTVYLDTNGGAKGTVVTRTPTSDISDLAIYQNRVITRHEDSEPMTILKMSTYDNDNDSDISFVAATGTLTVLANTELHIASSTTFIPGGDITINGNASTTVFDGSLHIDNNAIFTGAGTSTYRIGGSFTLDDGATFTSASTTVLMNATTTGKTVTTSAAQEITFNTIEFSGSGGGWNINGDIRAIQNIDVTVGTVTGTADITVVNGALSGNGTLSMGSGTTTIHRANTFGGTTPWTLANLVLGNGSVVGTTTPASNATTTILGKLTISTAHYLDAGSSLWNFAGTGNVFTESGTFLEDTSTVRYSGTGATNVISTTYYNLDLMAQGSSPTYTGTGSGIIVSNNLIVGGPNATTFTLDANDPAFDVQGDVTINSTGTLVGSASANFTVAGSWDNNGTYTGSGGVVTFDGGGTPTIASGNSSFSGLTINGSGSFTIVEPATTTGAFTLTNAGSFTVASGQSLAVGGLFTNGQGGGITTWTNSVLSLYGSGTYTINASTTGDTYETLSIGNGTQIRMWNSDAVTYDIHANGSLYSQDHDGVNGELYIYGAYTKTSGTDFWNYSTDFDGTDINGSPRAVAVYIRNGSSVLYTGGGLSVLGIESASTTIQNQGSGTYAFRIGGSASTTWSYYDLQDMDAAGLTLSGTPNVVSLAYGDITVSQNSGSGMTVGGSVLTQNPAKTFTNNYFATSTGVTPAFNVTATGTTASSWRFTNHTGTIDGEDFDVDPDGNPGYLVWDNSSSSITVSGTVYSDDGSTLMGASVCDGSTQSILLRVGGLTSYTSSCNGSGTYSIPGVLYSPGDSLIVYISGESEKAATVTEDPISNITGLDLYENRVIVRHEGADPVSIIDMEIWDSSDDGDIPFDAVNGGPDTLTLPADTKLVVWSGKTFEPGGNVTLSGGGSGAAYDGTLELLANAEFTAQSGESHSIGGSLISGAAAVVDASTATFTFTTPGASRTIDTNDGAFYNLTLNGAGSWTVTNSTLTIGNDLVIASGALTVPGSTTTIAGSFQNTGGTFVQNGGQMLFTSSGAEIVRQGGSNFGTTTFNGSGSWTYQGTNATTTGDYIIQAGAVTAATGTMTIGGDFINRGTFTHSNGTLRLTASTASTSITASTSDLYAVTIAGSGSFYFTDTSAALRGTLSILAGSLRLATGTLSIAGSFLNTGGSFDNASGTILFNSADTGETVNPGASPFHSVSFANAGGGWTVSAHATATGNVTLGSATSFTLASSTRLYVGGVFTNTVGGAASTWAGSTLVINTGAGYTVNTKTTGGDVYGNLIMGSSTALRMWDSSESSLTLTDTLSSLYSQDHAGVSGSLYIFGNYVRASGSDYWSYATDFDGTALGGSSRIAQVYHAPGATTTLTGGALNIVGASGFVTTVNNQGTGRYGVDILGGTLNAQYYSFANMGSEGLNLEGLTAVTSLSEGAFTLAVSGGSLITLASSTLNYNAGLTIVNTSFATTTAITGYNVNLVGDAPTAWTFTGHTGNFDGEYFDNDGIDDCGSLQWDNSLCLLTKQSAYRWRNDDGGEGVPDSEWYDLDWAKRKRVTLTNVDAITYTDAVVKLTVAYDADMQADFDDLRFTEDDGLTPTEHYIESYTASDEAIVWVKVPTIATSTTASVYMYYGEGTVSDASATTTFSAMDDFEDNNISEYSGDTGEFVVDTADAYERTHRLEAFDPANGKTDFGGMYNNTMVVSQGEKLRFMKYIDTGTGLADEVCTLFGTQNQTQNYAVCLELFGVDRMSLARNVLHRDTSGTVLASTTVTYSTGWYEVEVDWGTDDSIFVTLYKDGTQIATTSATDSNYTSGGIGYTLWGYHGGWDVYSARPLLANEPTTSFGFEQVPGGASWIAALNTAGSGINIGDNARVRFLVENTGNPIINQNYELEYAPKGAAPSCESVNFNTYVEVPDAASCGTSDICMESSSYFTNLDATTDVLGGEGVFTQGQIVEDPSNNTGNISIDSDEFTELEFAITPTLNVDDSNYCLRVSNEGTDLDAYTRVAEFSLLFTPNITSLSLNGGNDINLYPGTTTRIYATGTISDLNGYADIAAATTTLFRSDLNESCTADANNCYHVAAPQCSYSNCAGNSCDITCSIDMYYHADPTDIGTYAGETWRALLAVSDQGGAIATATAPSVDLETLHALSVDDSINYGALEVNADTGSYNASTTFENIGNGAIDVSIAGTDLTDGGASTIPVTTQYYATSTFTYSACTVCNSLSTSAANFELDLAKPTSTTPSVTDELFWGISVPFGVSGTPHHGSNIFYAISD